MTTNDRADLTRTYVALGAYDAYVEGEMKTDDTPRAARRQDELGREVGRAFGLDTADRNNLADCTELVRPGKRNPAHPDDLSFVRRMVADWKEHMGCQGCDDQEEPAKTFKVVDPGSMFLEPGTIVRYCPACAEQAQAPEHFGASGGGEMTLEELTS